MNGRIFVLLAATGLFVHVWNANHRPPVEQPSAVVVTTRSKPIEASALELTLDSSDPVVAPPRVRGDVPVRKIAAKSESKVGTEVQFEKRFEVIVRSKASPSVSSLWIEASLLPERLPPGIAVGLYQVVDNFGHVTLAQITPERLAQAGVLAESTIRDVYVQQSGNQRWYFIRQGELSEAHPAAAPAAAAPSTVTKASPSIAPSTDVRSVPVPAEQEVSAKPAYLNPFPMAVLRNRILSRQREKLMERATMQVEALRDVCLAAVPEAARKAGSERMQSVEESLQRMFDTVLQRIPSSEIILWGIDWSGPKHDIQELPSVSVPGTEVELPAIPLKTVRQTDSETFPPL